MITINTDELKAEIYKFNNAIQDFKPYTDNFMGKTVGMFDGFNSDFIEKVKDLLENMKDTSAPKLLEKSQKLYSAMKQEIETMEKVDEEVGKKIKGEQ